MSAFLSLILTYLLGSINTSIILSKIFTKKDIREVGSGNAGATNTLRAYGIKYAVIVFLFDILKGVLAILVVRQLTQNNELCIFLAGVGVILGHNFPIFFQFKGGKGISTSLGVLFVLNWQVTTVVLVIAFFIILITRYVSLGSMVGISLIPIGMLVTDSNNLLNIFLAFILAIIAIIKHKQNILKLANGTESKIGKK